MPPMRRPSFAIEKTIEGPVAGIDEAGRGPLAGPVVAAAVILPYTPPGAFLGLVPLPSAYWVWIAGFLAAYSVMTHAMKTWFNRRFGVST